MATPGQADIVKKRAIEMLEAYYQAPRDISIDDLLEVLPGSRIKVIMDQPWFSEFLKSDDDPTMMRRWIKALDKSGHLFSQDMAAISAIHKEADTDRWAVDFGSTPYRPSLIREALFQSVSDPVSPAPQEPRDGRPLIEEVP